jgi:hypothetical protein
VIINLGATGPKSGIGSMSLEIFAGGTLLAITVAFLFVVILKRRKKSESTEQSSTG